MAPVPPNVAGFAGRMFMAQPSLVLNVKKEGQNLVLEYSVANGSDEAYFLFNHLMQPGPTFSSEVAYACHPGGDRVVFLQGEPPRPKGLIQMTQPKTPAAVLLAPGATFRAVARAKVPLEEWHAYAPVKDGVEFELVKVSQAELRIAAVREKDKFGAEEYENFPGLFRANGHPIVFLEATAPIPDGCPLRHRLDAFSRFA
jgi:hypothetical protein